MRDPNCTMAGAAARSRQQRCQRKRNCRQTILIVLAVLVFLTGAALLIYPAFSQWYNARGQSNVIANYAGQVEELDDSEIERELERARVYNHDLTEAVSMADPFHDEAIKESDAYTPYNTLLNLNMSGVMA